MTRVVRIPTSASEFRFPKAIRWDVIDWKRDLTQDVAELAMFGSSKKMAPEPVACPEEGCTGKQCKREPLAPDWENLQRRNHAHQDRAYSKAKKRKVSRDASLGGGKNYAADYPKPPGHVNPPESVERIRMQIYCR